MSTCCPDSDSLILHSSCLHSRITERLSCLSGCDQLLEGDVSVYGDDEPRAFVQEGGAGRGVRAVNQYKTALETVAVAVVVVLLLMWFINLRPTTPLQALHTMTPFIDVENLLKFAAVQQKQSRQRPRCALAIRNRPDQ